VPTLWANTGTLVIERTPAVKFSQWLCEIFLKRFYRCMTESSADVA
jgi:hypothetical protein